MTPRALARIGAVALSLSSTIAPAATPLDDLIKPEAGNGACFVRIYDEAHLRRHPRQRTTVIAVWLEYESIAGGAPGVALGLGLSISQRSDPHPFFAQGGCEWDVHANRDIQGKRLMPTFKKEAGANCLMSARPDVFDSSSAQEGGFLVLDRGNDRDTLMVYLDDSLIMVKRANRGNQLDVRFGDDDRVLMLRRTGTTECAAVKEAVTAPEPGVAPRRR